MMRFTFALDLEPKDNNLIKSAIDRLEEPDVSEDEDADGVRLFSSGSLASQLDWAFFYRRSPRGLRNRAVWRGSLLTERLRAVCDRRRRNAGVGGTRYS